MKNSKKIFMFIVGSITLMIPMTYNACSEGFEITEQSSSEVIQSSPPEGVPLGPLEIPTPPCSGGGCEPEPQVS